MNQPAPLILVTGDDGIHSPGLRAAVRSVMGLGDLIVSAPCEQQSGSGRSLSIQNDGAIYPIDYVVAGKQIEAYAVRGSPAQAVMYAMVELVQRKVDLCVSGINFGENIGSRVTLSGTVGAAMEAADSGVPALAVSLQTDARYHFVHSEDVDFSVAAHFCRQFAVILLTRVLPRDVDLVKVDIPCDATPDTPWRLTRLSRQNYFSALPSGRTYLTEKRRLAYQVQVDLETLEQDSDVYAIVVDRVVSVTPISLELTSRVLLSDLDRRLRS